MESARELANASGMDIVDAAAQVEKYYAGCRYALVSHLVNAGESLILAMAAAREIDQEIPPFLTAAATELRDYLRQLGMELDDE